MSCQKKTAVVAVAWWVLSGVNLVIQAQSSPATNGTTSDAAFQHRLIIERDRLWEQAGGHSENGDYAAAIVAAKQALAIEIKLVGEINPATALSYGWIGDQQFAAEDFDAAAVSYDKRVEILQALPNIKPWLLVDARQAAADARLWAGLDVAARQKLDEAEARDGQSFTAYQAGNYREAVILAQQVLDRRREALGDEHPDVATSMIELAYLYAQIGKSARALTLLQQGVDIRKEVLGSDHPQTAVALNVLAGSYQSVGENSQALSRFQQALEINLKAFGKDSPYTAASLSNLAGYYRSTGEYARAVPLYKQALATVKKTLGDEHPDTATVLSGLANAYQALGDYSQALPLFESALAINRKAFGNDHPVTGASLNNLANAYQLRGDYGRAQPLCMQALEITQRVFGEDHPETAITLNNSATLYRSMGQYAAAITLCERALAINKKALGDDHPNTGATLDNLAGLYQATGDYARALQLFQQALALRVKVLGNEHPETATSLNNMALLHQLMGDYPRALALYEQALLIIQEAFGNEHPDRATTLSNVALLYQSMGDYARALPLFEQALFIRKEVLGEKHPETATSLSNLALLHQAMGEYDRAVPLFEQDLAITQSTLGNDHPNTAISLNNLALSYGAVGDYTRAVPLFEQALAINAKAFGDEHPSTALSLNNLANTYNSMGEHARALPLFEQALAIRKKALGDDHPDTAASLINLASWYQSLGEYDRALPLFEEALFVKRQALGVDHPNTAASLSLLACLYAAMDNLPQAVDTLLAGAAAERQSLKRQLFLLSDQRIRALLGTATPHIDLLASLPVAELGLEEQALETLLSSKAVAFEVLNHRRAAAYLAESDHDVVTMRQKLVASQRQLETLALRPMHVATADQIAVQRKTLRDAMQQLDEQLSRKLAAFLGTDISLEVSLGDLRAAMAHGAAHIEYFRHHRHDFKATGGSPSWQPARYAAFVVLQDVEATVWMIDLGPASEIDALIDQLARHLEDVKRSGDLADEQASEADYRELAAALSAKLFAPLAAAVGDARQVTLGPDGRLHEIAFEALLDDSGRYLIEAGYQFAYVNSGRDLLRKRGELGTGVAVFAGPDYALGYEQRLALVEQLAGEGELLLAEMDAAGAAESLLSDSLSRAADTRRGWRDLGEAALQEGREAATALANAGFGSVATYARGEALEEVVKRLVSPRVLVFITHGDFLVNESELSPEEAERTRSLVQPATDRGGAGAARLGLRAMEDPFLRSYLVLAGANEIDEEIPQNVQVENGWLTAREIAQLDLRGTDLVVLSACSTNRGDANTRQAVRGMRSAFLFAGARTIVGSLFEVPNAETRQLLGPFYEGVAAGRGKLASLNAAKLKFIRQRRETEGAAHPFYWASFILVGEP